MGSLSIGFVGAAIYDILPSIVREYRKKFPRVSVALHELSTPDQVHALHDNRIDIGFLRPPIPTQLLELEPIQKLSCTLCLPKAHPLAEKDEIHIEDLRMNRLYLLRDQYGQLCMIQFYPFVEKLDLARVLCKKQRNIKQLWDL